MLFRRDFWRSLVQLFAQCSNNLKVSSSCSASHPAQFQTSLKKEVTVALENLLKCLIIPMVKTFFLVFNQKSLTATFSCCLLCSHCAPLSLCCSSLWPLFRRMTLGFSSAFSYSHSALQPSPMGASTSCWGHPSPHGAHPWWRCQVFLALCQTLRNAIHLTVRFQAVHHNPLKLMVQPVFNHLGVHLSSPHLPSFGYKDVRLFCPFCAYKRFSWGFAPQCSTVC